MFYTGKSTACHTCRARRLKCDETRPFCMKCRRAGRECQGYRDESGFIIRDMTSQTIKKFESRRRTSSRSNAGSQSSESTGSSSRRTSAAEEEVPQSLPTMIEGTYQGKSKQVQQYKVENRRSHRADYNRSSLSWTRRKPQAGDHEPLLKRSVNIHLEEQAVYYFANRYALAPTQFLDPGYLPVLRLVSHKQDLGQCLSHSLNAVSLAAFSTKPNARQSVIQARTFYSKALALVNEEVQRPGSFYDDELLASVILLGLFEVFSSEVLDGWSSHMFGAAAMLGARGKVSFQNELGEALFRVVSNEMIKLTLLGLTTPHTGTEKLLAWLKSPTYSAYETPNASSSSSESSRHLITVPKGESDKSLGEVLEMKGQDAVDRALSGRVGTLPIPRLENNPLPMSVPNNEEEKENVENIIAHTKGIAKALTRHVHAPAKSDKPNDQAESTLDTPRDVATSFSPVFEGYCYKSLSDASIYMCGCVARMVTYHVMARCTASIPGHSDEDFEEAALLGRNEVNEIIRILPYFWGLLEETTKIEDQDLTPCSDDFDVSSPESDSSRESGHCLDPRGSRRNLLNLAPSLARSYLGFMVLWPISTAATTNLIDAQQFAYIEELQKYIADVCGLRMAVAVRNHCLEHRKMSGGAFWENESRWDSIPRQS